MIQAKQELLQALQAVLAQMAPGAPLVSAFESPKIAAHGDLAITVAMPLARTLKRKPRELAEKLVEGLRAQTAVQRWVQCQPPWPEVRACASGPEARACTSQPQPDRNPSSPDFRPEGAWRP